MFHAEQLCKGSLCVGDEFRREVLSVRLENGPIYPGNFNLLYYMCEDSSIMVSVSLALLLPLE